MPTTTLTARQAQDNAGFPNRYYLACPKYKILVCAIPKNGCTSLKKWFLSFADPAAANVPDVHKHCADHWAISLWEGPPRDAAFETFYTVAFLREPLKRIASAFIEKFVGGHPYGYFEPAREVLEDVTRLRGVQVELDRVDHLVYPDREFDHPASSAVDYMRGITFREFVNYLCRAPDEHLDVHWRPQCNYLWNRQVHLVGTVDRMTQALRELSQRAALPEPPEAPNPPRDETCDDCLADLTSAELYHRFIYCRGVLPPAAALYDDDLRMLAACRYRLDWELYDFAAAGGGHGTLYPRLFTHTADQFRMQMKLSGF